MTDLFSTRGGVSLKAAVMALVVNEMRGLAVAAPVLYAMCKAGGNGMVLWIGLCALAGIAVSVIAPLAIAKRLRFWMVRAG